MPASTIGTIMNFGYAGSISRTPDDITETRPVYSASANIPFGLAVQQRTDDTYTAVDSGLTAANFAGVAVARVKQNNVYTHFGTIGDTEAGFYAAEEACDVLKRGVVCVKVVDAGTPTTGGAVFVRKVLNGSFPNEKLGDFRTQADSTNTVALTQAQVCWYSNRKDANGIAELKLKYINN